MHKACALQLYRVSNALQTEAACKQLAVPTCSQAKGCLRQVLYSGDYHRQNMELYVPLAQLPVTFRGSSRERGVR